MSLAIATLIFLAGCFYFGLSIANVVLWTNDDDDETEEAA